MSALWPVTTFEAPIEAHHEAPLRRIGLGTLLRATARRHPERIAFVDPADKPQWCGRPAITWSYEAAAQIVARLAAGLSAWRLPAGSRIGLCLPGGTEAALCLLAVEACGHLPCLLPMTWDEDSLVTAAQNVGLSALLTQSRVGALSPAERACNVAARYFGLRYLASFGPTVPDGVINLDEIMLTPRGADSSDPISLPGIGLVTFAAGDPDRPIYRTGESLLAAAATYLTSARVAPGERILTLLPPHDLRGIVTGLGAALVSGATLETHGVFDGAAFAASFGNGNLTHLVAPGFLERNLSGRDAPSSLRSVTFVHRAPMRLPKRERMPDGRSAIRIDTIVDAVAIDETAIVSGLRGGTRDVALALGRPDRLKLPETLMAIRIEPDGCLAFRGQACAASPLRRGIPKVESSDSWRRSPFAAATFAGIATALIEKQDSTGNDAQDYFLAV